MIFTRNKNITATARLKIPDFKIGLKRINRIVFFDYTLQYNIMQYLSISLKNISLF